MVEIDFIYNQRKFIIEGKLNDKVNDLFLKLSTKINKKLEDIYFLYKGDKLNGNTTLKEIYNINEVDDNGIQILVNDISHEQKPLEKECLKPSKNIICPKCKENIRIIINNNKIKLYECKNNHIIDNISLKEFENTQIIDEKKIISQNCKDKNKNESYQNKFYRCFICKINLCPLCKTYHDKTHNIIDYEQKNYICDLHHEAYSSYCEDCKKDICLACENEHNGHKIISYGKMLPNIKALNEEIKNHKKEINKYTNKIKEIITKLNILIDNIDNYYKIYEGMINNYDIKKRNYPILQNLIDMNNYNNNFYKNIKKILSEKNVINRLDNIINNLIIKITNIDNAKNNDIINDKKEKKNNVAYEEKKTNIGQNPLESFKAGEEQNKINNPNNYYNLIDYNNNNQQFNNNNKNNKNEQFNIPEVKEIINKEYSYELVEPFLGKIFIYEDTDEAKIDLILKNNGKYIWPINTKLIYDKNSDVVGKEINLEQQKPGESKKYIAFFKDLCLFPHGEFNSFLWFSVNGTIFGGKIILKIIIKPKKNNEKKK